MYTDPIADYLTRLRNGLMAGHDAVVIPASKIKMAISEILRKEGYIHSFKQIDHEGRNYVVVNLKYAKDRKSVIHGVRRVSRPGLRVYKNCESIPQVNGGLGISILSTPKGVLSDREARKLNVGGEILASVW
ncbi:MAG: 30S ribosomal protein S8 [Holophagaceae bacterium]